jgi:hypothetical protein
MECAHILLRVEVIVLAMLHGLGVQQSGWDHSWRPATRKLLLIEQNCRQLR